MSSILTLARGASRLPILVACIALFSLMVLTFSDVILRSAFNSPIEAATEMTRILMAIVVFSVLPVISAKGGHISVDLTDGLFTHFKADRYRDALIYIASGLMLIWPAQRVGVLAERARSYGDVTEYLNIPQFYIGWFIAGAVWLTVFVMIMVGILLIFSPKLVRR